MRTRELKSLLLKKGWAGRTISREETVARLNPLLEKASGLGPWYAHAATMLPDASFKAALGEHQRRYRNDLGKLAETIFSCGGVAYNKVNRGLCFPDGAPFWSALSDKERALHDALLQERRMEHQIRTEAVLIRCMEGSAARRSFLGQCGRALRIVL